MSPEAAPPLPSQLKVHFLCCSANLWLIVESFCVFLTQFTLVVSWFVIYQPSCQPSPPVGGTHCRNYKHLLDKLLYCPLGRQSCLEQASKLTVLHLPYMNQKTSTVSCQITLNSLQTLICIGRDTCC